jgi:hypothetical protein
MRFLAVIGALAIIVVVGAAVFFLGGFYSVAASEQDNGFVAWALVHVRQASIDRHATAGPPGSLDDPGLVRAGAHAFSEGLNPAPPDLKDVVGEAKPAQLFWVIKNGIRMTGMPSFGATGVPDQEIWSIVAFLKKLPTVSDADFKTWSTSAP